MTAIWEKIYSVLRIPYVIAYQGKRNNLANNGIVLCDQFWSYKAKTISLETMPSQASNFRQLLKRDI